jgi:hypothetical protein
MLARYVDGGFIILQKSYFFGLKVFTDCKGDAEELLLCTLVMY